MNQIIPHLVWIGHAGETNNFRNLFDADIHAVVELAMEEPPAQPPREMIYCRFPLLDGSGNDSALLMLAIHTLSNLLERRVPTLVCCGAGLSRAPAVAAAALATVYQEAPEDCLKQLVQHHPSDVSAGLWNEIKGLLNAERM
jgi:protein-tyrosine phosphatase